MASKRLRVVERSQPQAPLEASLTIERLAAESGMTVRNIRAHRARGLLPAPVVRERVGYYGPEHLSRLKLIKGMQAEGFNLRAIQRLLEETRGAPEELISLKEAVKEPFESEEPRIFTLAELEQRFGERPTAQALSRAERIGLLAPLGEDRYEAPMPSLLEAAAEVVEQGVPLADAVEVVTKVHQHCTAVARAFVSLFLEDLWKPFAAAGYPEERWREMTEAIQRLRPLASRTLMGAFQLTMSQEAENAFGRELERMTRKRRLGARAPAPREQRRGDGTEGHADPSVASMARLLARVLICDLKAHIDETVRLRGWVHAVRDQKRVQFVVLRDESGMAQLVLPKDEPPGVLNEAISALTDESAVSVVGRVVADERVKLGGVEVQLEQLEVEAPAEPELPITAESALDKRIDWRYLDLRRPDRRLIFEVQSAVEQAMREHWLAEGFVEIHTPKLMGSASESGAELFRVDYFDTTAYLAQSPQFYKQMAMAGGFGKVFEIGPVFRANPSFTSRHDTEFTSVDVEISWIDSHEDVMAFEERWLVHVLAAIARDYGSRIADTFGVSVTVPQVPFPRIPLAQAKQLLADHGHEPPGEGHDLDPPSERALSAIVAEQMGSEFVFVTDYPVTVRPFYHMRHPDRPELTRSFDLLWRGIEITTGAQREHRYEQLLAQAREQNVETEPIQYYLDFFRFGAPPHGGFGFGLTRLLMQMLGQDNVREVTFLYRGPNRLTP